MKFVESAHPLPYLILRNTIQEDLGTLYFYENIVVWEANSKTKVSYISGFSILVKAINYLQPKPWVLISNRKNDYEVDSSGFQYVALAPYLIGAAIVSKKYTQSDADTLGRGYLGKPLHIYSTLENAYEWANALLKMS